MRHVFEVAIDIPDEMPQPTSLDAVVLVYTTGRGIEANFQAMEGTTVSPLVLARAVKAAAGSLEAVVRDATRGRGSMMDN